MSGLVSKPLRAVLIVVLGLGGTGCATSEFSWWSPPRDGVIRDQAAAIAVAHAMWASMNPGTSVASLATWQRTMSAHLDHGVWARKAE